MRINWFSPLRPARTDIANYTARLLPALSASCDVTFWTDQTVSRLAVDTPADVRQFTPDRPPWAELNHADVNVYHIGNNPQWHAAIWQLSRQQPGLVVLHETHLMHLFLGIYQQADHRVAFLEQVTQRYGPAGLQALSQFSDGKISIDSLSGRLPLTDLATTNALGILVHNHDEFDRLKRASSIPVMCAPLPYAPRVPRPEWAAIRARYTGVQRYRLVLFGHIDANRRLEAVLRALRSFPARDRFQCNVYGDVNQRDAIVSLIRDLSLESLVRIHGFVPESTLTAALQEAHLAINLRYPTMGEASGSQLRIWDHALPSVVTPVGWYARLPPDAVNFVRPEHETADLHALLDAFLRDPTRFAAQGLAGRRILERCHGVQTYAHDLVEFASSCGRNRGRVALRDVARSSAAELVKIAGPRGAAIGFNVLTEQVLALRGKQRLTLEPTEALASSARPRVAA